MKGHERNLNLPAPSWTPFAPYKAIISVVAFSLYLSFFLDTQRTVCSPLLAHRRQQPSVATVHRGKTATRKEKKK